MTYLMFETDKGTVYAKQNSSTGKAVTIEKVNKCTSINEVHNFSMPSNAVAISDYEYGEQLASGLMHIQKVRQSL